MTDIVDLQTERERRSPHSQGRALCMNCQHEWQAVVPVGVFWFECPACHAHKGFFKYEFARDSLLYTCKCDNQLFCISEKRTYCQNCGRDVVLPT